MARQVRLLLIPLSIRFACVWMRQLRIGRKYAWVLYWWLHLQHLARIIYVQRRVEACPISLFSLSLPQPPCHPYISHVPLLPSCSDQWLLDYCQNKLLQRIAWSKNKIFPEKEMTLKGCKRGQVYFALVQVVDT